VYAVVLPVLPPLEVVVDGNPPIRKFLAVFTDFALNSEGNVLEFTQYFSPAASFSFHVLYNTIEYGANQGDF